MVCAECRIPNPDDNRFCGQCGAALGNTLEETIRRKGFRDRQATEIEITEGVVERLMKWSKWLAAAVGVPLAVFVLMIGWSYHDVRSAVAIGKEEIQHSVAEGKKDIDSVRGEIAPLKEEVTQLQSDVNGYQHVNQHIADIQKRLTAVQGQVIDLGKRSLKVDSIELTGAGPGHVEFGELGCGTMPQREFCSVSRILLIQFFFR
jgi:hypothetical protein